MSQRFLLSTKNKSKNSQKINLYNLFHNPINKPVWLHSLLMVDFYDGKSQKTTKEPNKQTLYFQLIPVGEIEGSVDISQSGEQYEAYQNAEDYN